MARSKTISPYEACVLRYIRTGQGIYPFEVCGSLKPLMATSTVYRILGRMRDWGWVVDRPAGQGRKRLYHLTELGEKVQASVYTSDYLTRHRAWASMKGAGMTPLG